jgi:hypothetical protein
MNALRRAAGLIISVAVIVMFAGLYAVPEAEPEATAEPA